jgi:Anti-sigma-K factor rskA
MMDAEREALLALGAAGALTPEESRELERLLESEAAAVETQAGMESEPSVGAPAPPRQPASDPTIAPVVPIHRRRWWIAATAVAAAIVLVVGALVVTREADAPTDAVMADVLADDEAVTIELTGSLGELQLVKSEEHGATVLVGDSIEAPDAEQVLQLWAIADGEPASMGTFVPEDDGEVAFVMEGTEPEGTLYAVTVEPDGGSEQPTSEPVAGPTA